jgi:hypothetical protein
MKNDAKNKKAIIPQMAWFTGIPQGPSSRKLHGSRASREGIVYEQGGGKKAVAKGGGKRG